MNEPETRVNQHYATLMPVYALRKMFGMQLFVTKIMHARAPYFCAWVSSIQIGCSIG